MKILIDTHIAIWAVLNDPKLPGRGNILQHCICVGNYNKTYVTPR